MLVTLACSTHERSTFVHGFSIDGEYYYDNLLEKLVPDLTKEKALKLAKVRRKEIESRLGPMKSGETYLMDVEDGKAIPLTD